MTKKNKKRDEAQAQSRRAWYEECTRELKHFDDSLRKWPTLAKKIIEVEDEKLFTEGGYESTDEWIRSEAQASYRLCYMVKARYKALSPHFSDKELLEIPPQTADWASKSKNISPAALDDPKVREILTLPKAKAIKELQAQVPEQHIEAEVRVVCKFAAGQFEKVMDSYEAIKFFLEDEGLSFESAVEYVFADYLAACLEENGASRAEIWEEYKTSQETAPNEKVMEASV